MLIKKTYSSAAANTTGLKSNATGASWPLSANDCGDDLAHKITIKGDAATNHSAKTAVITGTAADGSAQTETVSLPNGTATVTSTKYFMSVTSVVPSATINADTMDIGWAAAAVTPAVRVASGGGKFPFPIGISVEATGTPAYSLQQSYGGEWFNHASIATKTASADGSLLYPVQSLRLIFTAASDVVLRVVTAE